MIAGQVLSLAKDLGHLAEGQQEVLETLCTAAVTELSGWLRDGVCPEDCGSAFPLAAAWLVLAGLAAGESGGTERFTAGEVSVQRDREDAAARQAALRLQATQVMAPYIRDGGFAFLGVDG